jgi:small-conductance mechanosensitive channel
MHLLDPLSNSFNGLTALVTSGTAASLVIVVAGVAVGTSIARRAGRADERAEATTGHARARRGDHVLATAPALALGAAGAWIVALAAPGEPAAAGWLSWSMLAGAAMLALCAMTAGISSIGAQVAGGLIAVVAFLQTTLLGTGMDLLVLGIALAMGASGAHWARRSGQRWQRVEMAIAQVTRSAGSPARRGRRRGR